MTFLFTARATYNQNYDDNGLPWKEYIKWSKLAHLKELVSLDGMLNELLIEPDYDNEEDWNYINIVGQYQTGFFTSLQYVFKRLKARDKYNLLTVVLDPEMDCNEIKVDGFEFVGYDLLDQDFGVSALTNCGGFDETFLPQDLNDKGLINDFGKAFDIKKRLLENNPEEHHADTNVIAVWRHKTIGR